MNSEECHKKEINILTLNMIKDLSSSFSYFNIFKERKALKNIVLTKKIANEIMKMRKEVVNKHNLNIVYDVKDEDTKNMTEKILMRENVFEEKIFETIEKKEPLENEKMVIMNIKDGYIEVL